MSSEHISFVPLADSVDAILVSLDGESASKSSQRSARTLRYQVEALRAVESIPNVNFTRANWSVGHQATIAIPVLAKTLLAKTSLAKSPDEQNRAADELVNACVSHCQQLAAQLKSVAEGRPL